MDADLSPIKTRNYCDVCQTRPWHKRFLLFAILFAVALGLAWLVAALKG